ncbi:WecB/TagA/CpsF family glycosyltransferase [uncultured Brevundimonas sp.]|uniref:WecB/TagA/CpsF family glycosyltransferase n=1 Tax=uncultured Brevundimonas sp. TaxID=213418 RepID=UPI00260E992C|nr:WecB/TagA/CpsF family glycosyltransferase [uncultured Brevundimonas sp.]
MNNTSPEPLAQAGALTVGAGVCVAESQSGFQRIRILGHDVDMVTPDEVLDWIQFRARGRQRAILANHNLHSLYLIDRDEAMARFYDMADLVQIDSMPMIRFAKLCGKPVGPQHRSTYLDWRGRFWDMTQRYGLRVFYLGGEPGVATGAIRMMEMAYPDLSFSGRDGFFDVTREGEENQSVLSTIRRFAPDILMVGMGMPRQEAWIAENYRDLPPCVVMPVGAAFDYEVGVQKAAPRWMGEWGIEWLYRLCHDPKRLASRYLYEPWFLIGPALKDLLRR